MTDHPKPQGMDSFLVNYDAKEVQIAAEFLSNWLPYLSRGLCKSCTQTLSHGIRSLHTGNSAVSTSNSLVDLTQCKEDHGNCSSHSTGSMENSADNNDDADTRSLGSWKDEAYWSPEHVAEASSTSETFSSSARPTQKMSWADMALEDELEAEEDNEATSKPINVKGYYAEVASMNGTKPKVALSREQREQIRFNSVERKKDFICLERVGGKLTNILEGLELHKGVFSAAEQKRIVSYVEHLLEMGKNGELKERTYAAPPKTIRGKGRVTLQFGCCYNYARDRKGNPPGILKNEAVDPLPNLFKVMIRRLVRWHVLPPSCVPDSCIVNIYEVDDCIPPHIDSHDFVRPFCTVSFLSECEILFGSRLQIVDEGQFSGSFAIPLPVGSVFVLNGNGADVAKHCVPSVPSRRISITFRKMDVSKQPFGYTPEPDLQMLQPLSDGVDTSRNNNASRERRTLPNPAGGRDVRIVQGRGLLGESPDAHSSSRLRRGESPDAFSSGRFRQGESPDAFSSGRFRQGESPDALSSGRFRQGESPDALSSGRFRQGESPDAFSSGRFRQGESPDALSSGRLRRGAVNRRRF